MNTGEHQWWDPPCTTDHRGIETCAGRARCWSQERDVDWRSTIVIVGRTRRTRKIIRSIRSERRLASILKRRKELGPQAYVFGSSTASSWPASRRPGSHCSWCANGHQTKRTKPGARVDREKLRDIDLHWHDLRHEGACRLLADGVDIRVVQSILGHSDIKTTLRYLNITDEELRKALTGLWERRRLLTTVRNTAPGAEAPAVGE